MAYSRLFVAKKLFSWCRVADKYKSNIVLNVEEFDRQNHLKIKQRNLIDAFMLIREK